MTTALPRVAIQPQNLRVIAGGREALDAVEATIDTAQDRLSSEVFTLRGKDIPNAFENAARRKTDMFLLTDPEFGHKLVGKITDAGATVRPYGDFPYKNHVKSVVADGTRGILTTAAFIPKSAERFELSLTFEGDAARALDGLIRSGGDVAATHAAVDAARPFGFVMNDAMAGVHDLSTSIRQLVDGAQHELIIATKRLEEPGIIESIKAAEKRGVNVIRATKYGGPLPLHANAVIADNAVAYVGSGHLTKRVLTGEGSAGRLAREMGMIIDQPDAISTLRSSLAHAGIIPATEAAGAAAAVQAQGGGLAKGVWPGLAAKAPAPEFVKAIQGGEVLAHENWLHGAMNFFKVVK